ncbi:cysteine desulfurase family protein [Streptococcus sp. DD12]|uniref:cysteine desulfurase family protein n=1 Tax=Streptococcus sp. DD12 TaxID=1777880 RepID=UPI000793B6DD|nr:cysteine desulfurase family protein [Streptococcus sp. DD12]KXT76162.1 Cysteine desulfurase [Streptococcus sp. DD12]
MIYFDNAATTEMSPQALATYQQVATRMMGNPSSLHQLGEQATRILQASRQQIAELLAKEPSEIFFTSGGTESDNWAIKGVAFEKAYLGKHIIISAVEHPAVRESALWLESQGFEVDVAPVDAQGRLLIDAFKALLREDTILVSIMAVNNEVGAIQPLKEVAAILADKPKVTFHVDAVQSVGKLALEEVLLPRVDLASFSAHKFHGPRGVGFLYKKLGKKITPLLNGGGQEEGLRSTTENVAGIAAMAKALRLTLETAEQDRQKLKAMKEVLYQALTDFPAVSLYSGLAGFVPNILTFGISGVRGEVLVHAFENHAIFLSTTSACSSKAGKPAGTLLAMGVPTKKAQTAVRISLDEINTMAEVEQFLTVFRLIYKETEKVR